MRALLLHPEPHGVRDAGVQPEGARVRARLPAGRLLPRQVHVRRRHRHRGHGTPRLQPGSLRFIPRGIEACVLVLSLIQLSQPFFD